MPSPFPGMDPYLEARAIWPDVHASLITYIREAIQPEIRPKYIARIGERVQLASFSQSYVPDVLLVHTLREPAPTLETAAPLVADEPQLITMLDEAYREPFIEIIARETGDVVTVIEVLSPANKEGEGRKQYLQKQTDLLATDVNLVEIDLLSYGKETVLARNTTITNPADWRYLIDISRGGRRNALEIYAIPLTNKLPNCRIPLRPPDADVVLDLTAVFNRCYDVGSYDLLIDYSQPPTVPLQENESAWLNTLLQEKGLATAPQE
ncbi:hypothetical protein MNBD_CHLOROFLEXI01-2943 [hydrothermal vent metagenome]|uniref:DUF4058 family protein n=1 Tax=hydrothermal vent metagenome TaxID=652676 RepID=A0A3B0V0Y2_9ZZZZ